MRGWNLRRIDSMRILTINPGSTSTKVAVFDGQSPFFDEIRPFAKTTIRHNGSEMLQLETLAEQLPMRQRLIEEFLEEYEVSLESIDGFIGRGGLLRPIESGLYRVNDRMKEELENHEHGEHASNLGGLIARALAEQVGKPAYIADPVVVDELDDVARLSGLNGVERRSIFHALNQKAVARKYSDEKKLDYEELTLIVAHLGGGISVGLHRQGRVVDVNNALDGDGPMSPERAGSLPVAGVIDMAFAGHTKKELKKLVRSYGGMFSYLNTKDAEEVSDMLNENRVEADRVVRAMVYQIAKEIGALHAVTAGSLDAIIITGGLAYNQDFVQPLIETIDHLGDITIYPGENELKSMAFNMQAYLEGRIEPKEY